MKSHRREIRGSYLWNMRHIDDPLDPSFLFNFRIRSGAYAGGVNRFMAKVEPRRHLVEQGLSSSRYKDEIQRDH